MKNYRVFSFLAVVLTLALAGVSSSLILGADVAATGQAVTAKAVNAETVESNTAAKCCGSSCASMTPEQCGAKMGVDVETAKTRMKECQKGMSASCRHNNAKNARCNPSDCPTYPNCKKGSHCKASKPCGGAAACKTTSNCSSRNIDTSN